MLSSREHTMRLTIRNDRADLALVRDALDRFGRTHGVSARALVQLQVVLDEVISNVIKYAWPGGGEHELSVSLTAQPGALEIEVVDDGKAFDPLFAAAPPARPAGKRPKPGGVGIHMAKKLVDGMEYARIDGRNHVKLIKQYAFDTPPKKEE